MNAIIAEAEQLTVEDALSAVKAAVNALRATERDHLSDQAALSRGRERLSSAEAELAKIEADNAAAIARHAKRLEEQTRSGSTAPVPQLALSDAHLSKELVAIRTLAAAKAMIANLTATVTESAGKVQAARAVVNSALETLRVTEVHARIWHGLELLSEVETVIAEVLVRTEGVNQDSLFGDEIHDRNRDHMLLRSVWRTLESRRTGPDSVRGVLSEQPPLVSARAALRERDAELTNPTKEQTQ